MWREEECVKILWENQTTEHRKLTSLSLFCSSQAISSYIFQQINYTILLTINTGSWASPDKRGFMLRFSSETLCKCTSSQQWTCIKLVHSRLPHRSTFPIWRTIMSGGKGQTQTVWVMWERNGGREDITPYLEISVEGKVHYVAERSFDTRYFSSPEKKYQKRVILDECKADVLAKQNKTVFNMYVARQKTCHVK